MIAWWFSIAMLNYQRVHAKNKSNMKDHWETMAFSTSKTAVTWTWRNFPEIFGTWSRFQTSGSIKISESSKPASGIFHHSPHDVIWPLDFPERFLRVFSSSNLTHPFFARYQVRTSKRGWRHPRNRDWPLRWLSHQLVSKKMAVQMFKVQILILFFWDFSWDLGISWI